MGDMDFLIPRPTWGVSGTLGIGAEERNGITSTVRVAGPGAVGSVFWGFVAPFAELRDSYGKSDNRVGFGLVGSSPIPSLVAGLVLRKLGVEIGSAKTLPLWTTAISLDTTGHLAEKTGIDVPFKFNTDTPHPSLWTLGAAYTNENVAGERASGVQLQLSFTSTLGQ